MIEMAKASPAWISWSQSSCRCDRISTSHGAATRRPRIAGRCWLGPPGVRHPGSRSAAPDPGLRVRRTPRACSPAAVAPDAPMR
jgi:hypothetical protein